MITELNTYMVQKRSKEDEQIRSAMYDLQRQLMTLLILSNKKQHGGEQDGGGVGGHRVPLFSWILQEYIFRNRSACRTPAESRQEYLTSRKEYRIMQNLVG